MLVIRASSTDRALDCSGSLIPIEHAYNPNSDEARGGNAIHEVMAQHVREGSADVDRYSQEFDVDLDELAFLYGRGKQALAALAKHFPDPAPELRLSAVIAPDVAELRGTADLLSITADEPGGRPVKAASIADWKSGYVRRQYAGQVRSYSLMLFDSELLGVVPESGFILGAEVWLRLGEMQIHHFTAADLEHHRRELLEQVKASQRAMVQYGPGDACHFCPRQQVCGAREDWMRGSANAIAPISGNAPVTRESIGALYPRAKALRSALAQYDRVLGSMLADGPVPMGDGNEIRLVVEEQDRLNAAALPLLREQGFTEAELARCTRVAKTELLGIVGEKSPRGLGAANKRKVLEALRAGGAVDREPRREKAILPIKQESKS